MKKVAIGGKDKESALKHYQKWRVLPFGDRFPLTKRDFAHQYGLDEKTLQLWDTKLEKPELSEVDESDPEAWLQAQLMNLYKAVTKSAQGGNAQSQKLLAQLMGRLVEKQEVTLGLSADELTRRNLEAERQLRGISGHRVEKVSEELPLLPEDLRLHTEQEHGSDS